MSMRTRGRREPWARLVTLAILGASCAVLPARAERVYLTNGGQLVGRIAKETKEGIWIAVPQGKIFFKHGEILRVEPTPEEMEPQALKRRGPEEAAPSPEPATAAKPPDSSSIETVESQLEGKPDREPGPPSGDMGISALGQQLWTATDSAEVNQLVDKLIAARTPEADDIIRKIVDAKRDQAPPAAIRALSRLSSQREAARKLVEELLLSKTQYARWEAAEALVAFGDLEALMAALANPDPVVRTRIAGGITQMAQGERRSEVLSTLGKASLSVRRSPDVRERIVEVLGVAGGDQSIDVLEEHLFGADEALSLAAAKSLGNLRSEAAYNMLIAFARTEVGVARRVACYRALMGAPRSIAPKLLPSVMGTLEAADPGVQEAATELLGQLTGLEFGQNVPGWLDWWRRQTEAVAP